jgi:hypothetical protein
MALANRKVLLFGLDEPERIAIFILRLDEY